MEAKLRQLMKHEGLNSTRLAEILGIQASGISHIMSGRNKPSSEFLIRLLQHFPQISADWLMRNSGPMYISEIKGKSADATKGSPVSAHQLASASINVPPANSSGATSSLGSAGQNGANGWGGNLFGPDNRDIIPATGIPAAVSMPLDGGFTAGGSGQMQGAKGQGLPHNSVQNSAQNDAQLLQSTGQNVGQNVQNSGQSGYVPVAHQPVYQAGGFSRAASIERIVVFYKDKTFTEYQPESV